MARALLAGRAGKTIWQDGRDHKAAAPRPFEVTNRLVLAIAVPMMIAYVWTPLIGLVDTAVVGQLGDAALLGGLAAGAMVFDWFLELQFLALGHDRHGGAGIRPR